jgi:pimeloyl-ACP methyl ester carboxylesterase
MRATNLSPHNKTMSKALYYTVQGQGPDLLLLHGLGASSFSWRHNIAPLSQHYRVWTLDLPGHGRSPADLEADYSLPALVQAISAFLDRHGITRVALAGNSLGGGLSLLLARERPELVSALVLIDPAAALTHIPYMFYPLRLPMAGYLVATLLGDWFLPWFLRRVYYRRELVTAEVIAGYGAPYRELTRRLVLRRFCQRMQVRPLSLIQELLAHLSQPAVLIWGAEDRILSVSQAHWIKEHLPQAGLHVLPEVGHAPQEEAPEAVNKIIIAFLSGSLKN